MLFRSISVLNTIQIGPTPTVVKIRDLGGEGEKFLLRVYSRPGAVVKQLPGEKSLLPDPGDEEVDPVVRETFTKYDTSGDGSIDQREMHKVLLELDMLPNLNVEESAAYLAEQFAAADTNTDGKVSFSEFVAYYNGCIVADHSELLHELKQRLLAKVEALLDEGDVAALAAGAEELQAENALLSRQLEGLLQPTSRKTIEI